MSDKVDTIEKTAQHQNPLELVDWLSDHYQQFDQDQNGRLSASELKSASEVTIGLPGQRAATYALNHLEIVENESKDQWGWESGITKKDLTNHKEHLESGLNGDSGKELKAALSQAASLREFIQKTMPRIDDDGNRFISYSEIAAFGAVGNPTETERAQAAFIRDNYDVLNSVRFAHHPQDTTSSGARFGKIAQGIQSQDVLNLEDALNPAVKDARRKLNHAQSTRKAREATVMIMGMGTLWTGATGGIVGGAIGGPVGGPIGVTGGLVVGFVGSAYGCYRLEQGRTQAVDSWHDRWAEDSRELFLEKSQAY